MGVLTKSFELDAGHRLSKHDFECQNLHGHRYRFEICIEGDVDTETGMIVDFANVKAPVMEAFDHNFILNEADPILAVRDELEAHQDKQLYVMDGEPTAENIAIEAIDLILDALDPAERDRIDRIEIELYETPNSTVIQEHVLADDN